jgi:hypothetical protein
MKDRPREEPRFIADVPAEAFASWKPLERLSMRLDWRNSNAQFLAAVDALVDETDDICADENFDEALLALVAQYIREKKPNAYSATNLRMLCPPSDTTRGMIMRIVRYED